MFATCRYLAILTLLIIATFVVSLSGCQNPPASVALVPPNVATVSRNESISINAFNSSIGVQADAVELFTCANCGSFGC